MKLHAYLSTARNCAGREADARCPRYGAHPVDVSLQRLAIRNPGISLVTELPHLDKIVAAPSDDAFRGDVAPRRVPEAAGAHTGSPRHRVGSNGVRCFTTRVHIDDAHRIPRPILLLRTHLATSTGPLPALSTIVRQANPRWDFPIDSRGVYVLTDTNPSDDAEARQRPYSSGPKATEFTEALCSVS